MASATATDNTRWHALVDVPAMQADAFDRIVAAANRAIKARGQFLIVLAGGNTPRVVYEKLTGITTDWSRWHVYYGDERCLPPDHLDRNSKMATDAWLSKVAIPAANIHTMNTERGSAAAASAYCDELRGVGDFDLVLLGLGEDGHTASLFPDHEWGLSNDSPDAIAVANAPKPPPDRVSLSAARINRAREVIFLVAGASKREPVTRWRAGENIAARSIQPAAGVDVLIEASLLQAK